MVIILMGPQGSGKTTQAERLSEAFGIPHLESGAIFREIAQQDSELGHRVHYALSRGQLVDKADADVIIEDMFRRARYHDHVIVDGFPRDLDQAQSHRGKIDRVFYLHVSEDVCISRLMRRGRVDDTPELIRERLRIYVDRTKPLLRWFTEQAILETVDGNRDIDTVFYDLYSRIARMLQIGEIELLR